MAGRGGCWRVWLWGRRKLGLYDHHDVPFVTRRDEVCARCEVM